MAKRKRLTPPRTDFLSSATELTVPGPTADQAVTPRAPIAAPIAHVAGDAASAAAAGELAALVATARAEGRLAQSLPLAEVDADYLVRDRIVLDEAALQELCQSLRARGQRTPIEVVDLGAGVRPRYGLVSGWRRLTALRRLAIEDPAFDQVAAIVRAPDSAAEAYLSMVEENEIRVGLSFYERARIVLKALEDKAYPDQKTALQTLFANVSRAKRSKIKSFMSIVSELDAVLRFPAAISERLGLALVPVLEDRQAARALVDDLTRRPAETGEEEIARLTAAVEAGAKANEAQVSPSTPTAPAPPADTARRTSARPTPRERQPLSVTFDQGVAIHLTGSGADADLLGELKAWLRRRGHALQ